MSFDNPYIATFWKSVLERISIGDAPFGTIIHNHQLKFRKSQLDLADVEPMQLVNFFIEKVGLQLQFISFHSWKDIKKKVIKDNLIQDFVNRAQQQYALESQYTARLLSLIHLYITIKRILPSEIHICSFPHMYIEQIDGIEFRQGEFLYIALQDRNEMMSESSEFTDGEYTSSSSDDESSIEDDDSIE